MDKDIRVSKHTGWKFRVKLCVVCGGEFAVDPEATRTPVTCEGSCKDKYIKNRVLYKAQIEQEKRNVSNIQRTPERTTKSKRSSKVKNTKNQNRKTKNGRN